MSVHIHVDTSDVDHELDRLQDAPDLATLLRLEAVLTGVYQETQRVVHVQTGSLKGSGAIDSEHGRHTWRGEITYGGAAVGFIHDPVRYAELEQSRGGAHDFMRPVYHADQGYHDAILAFLRGEA